MALEFDIVVLTKYIFIPFDATVGLFNVAGKNKLGQFTAKTRRTDDKPFGMRLKFGMVGSRMIVISVNPCF